MGSDEEEDGVDLPVNADVQSEEDEEEDAGDGFDGTEEQGKAIAKDFSAEK